MMLATERETERYADSIARVLRARGHDSAADHVVSLADGVDMHMRRVRALEDGIRDLDCTSDLCGMEPLLTCQVCRLRALADDDGSEAA